jgi:polyhydroxyalkanoate synthesis regulator phasin
MKRLWILLAAGIFLVTGNFVARAGEIDLLLQKLVDKGILSAGEAQTIATETKEEIKKENVQGKNESIPQWIQNIKLKGDFRARYELVKDQAQHDNSRARIRARLGLESRVNDKVSVGVGIATGPASNPRSRNVTLGNDSAATNTPGSPKDITLDYAYGKYTPFSWASITVGKFQNPLWQPSDVFWCRDITPEGLALNLNKDINPKVNLFLNGMMYILRNDSRTDKRPYMDAMQPGVTLNFTDKLSLKTSETFYYFKGIQNHPKFSYDSSGSSPYTYSGNTLVNGNYKYNYNTLQTTSELGLKDPLGGLLPYASIFGDYMYNPDAVVSGAGGYDIGLKFGAEQVSDWGQWQQKLIYSKLGRNCWLSIFPNVDRYAGDTNSRAEELVFEYGLGKNFSVLTHYYFANSLTKTGSTGREPERVLQVDFNFKF